MDGLLAEVESALTGPEAAKATAEERAGLRFTGARALYDTGRTAETADHLEQARTLLTAETPDGGRSGAARELLGHVLAGLASVRLLLGAPDAAEAAARAALDVLAETEDDLWNETRWHAAVVLVRILRARGAVAEAGQLMTEHEVEADEVDGWTGWED